jgi:hypothetical protein
MMPMIKQRGMALVGALFAVVLLMTLLAVMVDVGTVRLRRANEELRATQAIAAADAGAAWVRALLVQNGGDTSATFTALAHAHSALDFSIDDRTQATVTVSLQMPAASTQTDHLDINLQENSQIAEAPIQVVATASIVVGGQTVASRTVTTMLRSFHNEWPFSEVVGVIDDAGPDAIESPGDPAGQVGDAVTTDLRFFAYTQTGTAKPKAADKFENDSWFDGNTGAQGFLP